MNHPKLIQLALAIAIALPRLGAAGEMTGTTPVPSPVVSIPPAAPPAPSPPPPARHEPQPEVSAVAVTPAPAPAIDARPHFDAMLGIGSEHLNLGIGLRGGKTLDNHVYLGGTFVYHLGEHASTTVNGMTVSSSTSAFYVGPEIGYDFALAAPMPFVLRPYIGIGIADASASSSGGGSASQSELAMWPGVAGHYQLQGSNFEIGADLRLVTGPWGNSFGLFALGAMHFGS
jgi:hypothetical protein